MFKKFLAATLVMFHVLTFSNPVFLFAGDGAIITDANGNVVATGNDIILPGGTYNYANADVALGETRNFTFTDTTTTQLNIIDTHTTEIIGRVNINGSGFGPTLVIMFNPNGIINKGTIAVGPDMSLVLTNMAGQLNGQSLDLSRVNQDTSMIINDGTISIGKNSNIALVGSAVSNTGTINANGGAVVLAAGDKVSLDLTNGAGLIKVAIDEAVDAPVFDSNGNKVADAISNTGTIKNNGGVAILSARALEGIFDNVINHTGLIEANSVGSVNGRIVLNGGDLGITSVSGTLNAIGDDLGETGGSIEVYGEKVGLWDGASLDASGMSGGGTIYIGGQYQGLGTSPNSKAVYLGEWADVKADALLEGNGGEIIVWSDDSTQVHGTISARGGILSGDGGFIETSSKGYLDVSGVGIDVTAPAGNAGSWLLDPYNISIVAGAGTTNNTGAAAFTPNGNNSQIGVDLINNQLNAGTNVTISTGAAGAQVGTITLALGANIAKTLGGNATLTMNAANSITLNGIIGATSAFLNVILNAAGTISLANSISTNGGSLNVTATGGTSDITLSNMASDMNTAGGNAVFIAGDQFNMSNNDSSIITAGGQLDITANRDIDTKAISTGNGNVNVTSITGNISLGKSITTTGGDVTANAADGISLASAAQIMTSGGNFTANANTDADSNGDFGQGAGGSLVSTDSGDIAVNAKGIGVTGSFATTSGNIGFTATNGDISITNTLTTGTGDINLDATGDISLKGQNADVTTGGGDFNVTADTDANSDGDFIQDSGDGTVDTNGGNINVEGDVVKISGTLATGDPANGGDITLTGHAAGTNVDIKSSAVLNTQAGSGGSLFAGGGVSIAGTLTFGQGNIILNSVGGPGPGLDLIITVPIISATSIFLSALRDIIVDALVMTTNAADGNITLRADSDNDGSGGVWLRAGEVDAAQNALIQGSDLFAVAGQQSVLVDADGVNNQISADGDVTLEANAAAAAGNDMVINGIVSTPGTLTINSVGNINTSNDAAAELIANNLALNSASGIDAEIDANNVAYNNSTSGNVSLEDMAGGLTVTGAVNGGAGSTTITTHSPLTIAANIVQAGAISLNAGEVAGAGDNLTVNNGITVRSTGGGVTLNAGDNIALGTGSLVQSDASSVNMVAGFGDLDGLGSISLGGLVSGLTFVIMNAAQNISDTNGASNNISAGGVNATAATGIDFDSSVTNITALNTGTGNINIDEADFVNVNSVVANNGNVTVTNASNNMNVSTVTASNGTATLTSTLGGIVDANAGALNVTADVLVANANLGIDLDTQIAEATLNSGANTNIDNQGNLDLNTSVIGNNLFITSATGNITDTGGTVVVSNEAHYTTLGAGNDITLNNQDVNGTVFLNTNGAGADATFVNQQAIDFGNSNVGGNLTASVSAGGGISDSAVVTVGGNASFETTGVDDDIIMDQLAVTGTTSVATNASAGSNATVVDDSLNLASANVGGTLTATAPNGDMTLSGNVSAGVAANLNSNNGKITQTGGGITTPSLSFSAGDDVTLTGGTNNVDLFNNGSSFGNINLVNSGATQINNLLTIGGDITYNHTGTDAVEVTGTVDSGFFGLVNGGTITINNLGGFLTIKNGAVLTTLAGAGGALFASNVTIEGGSTLNLGQGDIILNGGGLDLIIDIPIISNTSIFLSALRDIIVQALVQTTNPADGNITLRADSDNDGVGGVLVRQKPGSMQEGKIDATQNVIIRGSDLFILPGQQSVQIDVNALDNRVVAQGDILIEANAAAAPGNDMNINGVVSTPGTLVINSVGNINSSNDQIAELVAGNLALRSVNGIDVEIDAVNAAYVNDGPGDVFIEDMNGGLTITTVDGIVGGTNTGGSSTVQTHSPLTIAANVTSLNNISLNALGTNVGDDLTLAPGVAVVSTNAGDILLTAGNDVNAGAGSVVTTTGTGTVTVAAGEDFTDGILNQDGNATGDVNMAPTSAFRSEDGNISVTANEHINVAEVNADGDGDNVRGDVLTNAITGEIMDSDTSGILNITADVLTMFAAGRIGLPSDPIETKANVINALAGLSIYLDNIGDVVAYITSLNGSIGVNNIGHLYLGFANAPGGDVNLSATGSIIAVSSGTQIVADNNISLTAGGVIGTTGAGINTQLNNPGTLTLNASGNDGGVSANVGGNFGESSVVINNAPGLVFLNGLAIGGDGINDLTSSLAQLFVETLPFNQLQTGRLDGRYAFDFPGLFNADRAAQAPLVSINTDQLELPVLQALPPTTVRIPGTAAPERPLQAPEAPRTAAPTAPRVQGQNPPTIVPIPAEAVPTLEKDVENRN